MTETQTAPSRPGMVTFAAVLLIVAGLYEIVYGLEGLANNRSLNADGVPIGPLSYWAVSSVVFGVLQLVAAWLLFQGKKSGAVAGLILSAMGMTYWFCMLPVQPNMSLAAILVGLVIVYALTAHMHELEA